jgi:site-specific recombinase XerD
MPRANPHVIGPLVRRFLLEEVGIERNLSINTQRSYRDTLRLLLHFLAERYATEPTQVTVEHLTVEVIKHFLTSLEEARGNTIATRHLRLTARHAFFRFVARQSPELIEHATQLHNIPLRRTLQPIVTYLEQAEIDAVLATPDRTALQGQRDYALLLFLYNTGARATEAAQTNVGALQLDSSPAAVRFLGKGRKVRLCPLWSHTVEVLRALLGARLAGRDDLPVVPHPPSSADHPFRHAYVGRAHGRQGGQHDAIAAAEKSQSAYDASHHRRRFAARWGRHEHHTSLARPRLLGDHEPVCASRPGHESKGLGNLCTDAHGGQ